MEKDSHALSVVPGRRCDWVGSAREHQRHRSIITRPVAVSSGMTKIHSESIKNLQLHPLDSLKMDLQKSSHYKKSTNFTQYSTGLIQ